MERANQAKTAIRQGGARALISDQDSRGTPPPLPPRSRTSVPNVQPSPINLNSPNIPEVRQQKTRSAPLSPIERIQQEAVRKMSLRDRARENPAVAASLLGGLGNADLL